MGQSSVISFWMKAALIFLFLSPLYLWADEAGRISMVRGEASLERGGEQLEAKMGMVIHEGDRFITGERARVQLLFKDETVITVGRSSEFVVEAYAFDEAAGEAQSRFGAMKGGFRAVTGRIGKVAPDQFQLETPTATMGIRGTKFIGNITPQGAQIACDEGAIVVTSRFDGSQVEVPAGRIVSAPTGGGPMEVREYTSEEFEALENESGAGEEGEEPQEAGEGAASEESADEPESTDEAAEEATEEEGTTEELPADETPIEEEGAATQDDPQNAGEEEADSLAALLIEEDNEGSMAPPPPPPAEPIVAQSHVPLLDEIHDQMASDQFETALEEQAQAALKAFVPDALSVPSGTGESLLPPLTPAIDDRAWNLRQSVARGLKSPDATTVKSSGFVVGESTAVDRLVLDGGEHSEWGYWQGSVNLPADRMKLQVWVAGIQTPTDVIDRLKNEGATRSYNGQAIGAVHNIAGFSSDTQDAILLNTANRVQINVDFGAANPVSGYIRFQTERGAQWDAALTSGGALNALGYSHNAPGGSVNSGYGGESAISGGSVQGRFFGSDAEATGGGFNLQSDQGTATGVYRAQ